MTDNEIIDSFFDLGCVDKHNNPLPLRNCEKIRKLYERDLAKANCCGGWQHDIHYTYRRRLKEFLRLEKH